MTKGQTLESYCASCSASGDGGGGGGGGGGNWRRDLSNGRRYAAGVSPPCVRRGVCAMRSAAKREQALSRSCACAMLLNRLRGCTTLAELAAAGWCAKVTTSRQYAWNPIATSGRNCRTSPRKRSQRCCPAKPGQFAACESAESAPRASRRLLIVLSSDLSWHHHPPPRVPAGGVRTPRP